MAFNVMVLPPSVPVGITGALGTARKLAIGLIAVALPACMNLAEKSYKFPAVSPVNVRLVCQAPSPTRYSTAHPAGGIIAFNVINAVVLLARVGAAGAVGPADGIVIVLTTDHALSFGTLKAPWPL